MAKAKSKPVTPVDSLTDFAARLNANLDLAASDPTAIEGMTERVGNPITLGPRVIDAAAWATTAVLTPAVAPYLSPLPKDPLNKLSGTFPYFYFYQVIFL